MAENTAGTQGNKPKTVYSRIYQNTETGIPLKPAGSMYPVIMPDGVFQKYGHKSGTPPGYRTLSAPFCAFCDSFCKKTAGKHCKNHFLQVIITLGKNEERICHL
jgi:hypothetical protein